ncbi:MAG: Fe-S cluster assembly protein SufD [Bacteroidales bacterium]|nr:Fe-S cluster assembly protein SufD [Bacteroidales bacterium]
MNRYQDINNYFAKYVNAYAETANKDRKYFTDSFLQKGVPPQSNELWRNFNWNKIIENTYTIKTQPDDFQLSDSVFSCDIQNIDTYMFTFMNGWYVHNNAPLTIFPNGIIIGSFRHATAQYASLIQHYMEQSKKQSHSGMFDMASALYQDGCFIYIPDNVKFTQPIQMVNVVNNSNNLFINMKNLVIVGKNASLSLIHCDDTIQSGHTLINTATELFVEDNAELVYFKLENEDKKTMLINDSTIYQGKKSRVCTFSNVFNGGVVHNSLYSHLLGEGADIDMNGLYLVDKQQNVVNCVSVNHHVENCTSHQLYNGIMDDDSQAGFVGHIYVAQDAQKTEAYQVNHNILLTDRATINTKPFLEIYADDVKCSHGATVGQLDEDAVFYMRSRGICEKNAKMLLMHAFAKEVVDKISIAPLVGYTENLVEKRLSGQTLFCAGCTKVCEQKPIHFEIKMPEL